MNLEVLAPYLAGPGAAVLVLLLVGAGVYRLAVNYLMPTLTAVVDRHMTELERANLRHEESVAKHLTHIAEMGARYDRLNEIQGERHAAVLEAVNTLSEGIGEKADRIERKVGGLYHKLGA